MQEPELNQQSDFMIEKIKQRPVNKRKLLRRTIITAAMAVIFGLIACFTFLVLEPVISNFLYPEEEPQVVVFPEDQEEMSPEEMLSDIMQQENQANQANQTEEQVEDAEVNIEQIMDAISDMSLTRDNYRQLYSALSGYVEELNKSMVTVTGVTSNIDWFNNVEESENQSYGVIIAENGMELLILADYTPLSNAESLTVTFYNNEQVEAQIKTLDKTTNLAIIAVRLDILAQKLSIDALPIAGLGSSGGKTVVGTPVVALGSPMGIGGSVGYGIVTAVSSQQNVPDTNYKFLFTDIMGSQNATGVLFNLNGKVLGIITNTETGTDMGNVVTAYGITELKKIVENMSNSKKTAYMGLYGVDVTRRVYEELQVPYGAYIMEVEMDSPAMMAGIQPGDVLVSVNDRMVYGYDEYTTVLHQLSAGEMVEITIMRKAQDEYKEMKFNIILGEMQHEIY